MNGQKYTTLNLISIIFQVWNTGNFETFSKAKISNASSNLFHLYSGPENCFNIGAIFGQIGRLSRKIIACNVYTKVLDLISA